MRDIFLSDVKQLLGNYRKPESSDDLQLRYLERYGYLEPDLEVVGTRSGQKIERAILKFQNLAGLELT